MKEVKKLLSIVPDEALDHIINELADYRKEGAPLDHDLELCGALASREWRARYPNTIAPCMFKRARKKGFPDCYMGPTQTIDLDTGTVIDINSLETVH